MHQVTTWAELLYSRLQNRYEDILAVTFIGWTCYNYWRLNNQYSELLVEFLQYAPNAYRLDSWLWVFLHDKPFSLITIEAIVYMIVLLFCYFTIRPQGKDYILFFVWIFYYPYIHHTIQLILFVILVKYRKEWQSLVILILLAFLKELAVWQGFGYLLFEGSQPKKRLILTGILAALVYAGIRYILIGDKPYYPGATFFTVPIIIPKLFFTWENLVSFSYILSAATIIVLLFLTIDIENDHEWKLVLWNAAPVLLFALFWENQLWLPIFIIIIAHRQEILKKMKENSSDKKVEEIPLIEH